MWHPRSQFRLFPHYARVVPNPALPRVTSAVALGLVLALTTASPALADAAHPAPDRPAARAEILWDTWGVPHIYAENLEALGFAYGWAQMAAHGNLLLHLYGESRGRAAEYWGGQENLERDRIIHTFGLPELAEVWVQRQSPEFGGFLQAFVKGLNAFASEHPEALAASEKVVLPLTAADVMGHMLRAIHLTFVGQLDGVSNQMKRWERTPGSNGWALSPKRSASGNALLLANPHLPWNGLFVWFEAHWNMPGLDAYGATLIGLPTPGIAFNQHLGWTHTVNTHDGCDLFELSLAEEGYRWDGQVRAFETSEKTLRIRQPDGWKEEKLTVRRSIHGPVIHQKTGRALAARVVGLDAPDIGQEYLDLIRARNLEQFETVLRRLQLPMFTVLYADADGHILHLFGGLTPLRPPGNHPWGGIVPGDTSATLWTRSLPYDRLPRVVDPASGWLQNANDPPWTTTFPKALDPDAFPTYLAPRGMALRPQRSAELLMANAHFTLDQFITAKHDTHVELADRILDDLLAAADHRAPEKARQAASVLRAWDRKVDAESRGAALFHAFVDELRKRNQGAIPFARRWDEDQPLATPQGLADPPSAITALEAAVDQMRADQQPLDVAWGTIHRLRRDHVDLPANGSSDNLGVFRSAWFRPASDGRMQVAGGDSYVCAVEFSRPVRARAVLAYGNVSQPGSKHRSDQLELVSRKQLRPVWLKRAEIEAHLEKREAF